MKLEIEIETDIDRPPQQVFEFLANAENMPRWRTDVEEVEQITDGPPRQGTRFRFRREKPHVESESEWVEFEENRRLAWQGDRAQIGPASMQFSGSHNLYPRGDGTHLRCIFVTRFGGMGNVVGPFLNRKVRKELEDNFRTLKRIVESEPATSPPAVGTGPDAPSDRGPAEAR